MTEEGVTREGREHRLDCEAVARALWDYLDDRCDRVRRDLIEEHLALCESCRSHAEFERKLLEKLAETGRGNGDPTALRSRVLATLRGAGWGGGASDGG